MKKKKGDWFLTAVKKSRLRESVHKSMIHKDRTKYDRKAAKAALRRETWV